MPETRVGLASRRSPIERGCGDPLVDLLDADPILRRYAVDAVELDSVGLHALRERLLEDSHGPVRLAAGERLARAAGSLLDEDPSTRAELVGWLTEALADPLPSVREVACRALARHGSLEHGCQLALARLVTDDPVWWVRRAAARALAAVAGEAAIEALMPGLDDPFWRVRHGVVQALELIVTRSSRREPERERLRNRVLEVGGQFYGPAEPAPSEVARAALAYLASGWPEGEDQVPELLGIIRDPGAGLELSDADPAVVTARLHAAGHVDPASLVPLLAESHESLRDEAARRLAALDDPACLEPALAWLEDPRIPNAPAAVRSLLARLDVRARGLAERALILGRPGGIAWAAGWIAEHPAEPLHELLLGHLDHPRADVRAAIMTALGQLLARERGRDMRLHGRLLTGLRDAAPEVRDAAALGLLSARVVDPQLADASLSASVRALVLATIADADACTAALADPSGEVRAAAVATLGRLGCLSADARSQALADPDPRVRVAALDLPTALALLGANDERDAGVRRAAVRLLVGARSIAPELFESLSRADDPWIRARAVELIDPEDPGAESLATLLLATRDHAAMVRLAASSRLDAVPELAARLEPLLAADDPQVAIAAWSRLIVELPPEQAAERLERALVDELHEDLHAHLRELAVLFGAPAPARPAVPILATVAPTRERPAAREVDRRPLGRSGIELAPLIISGAFGLTPSSLAFAAERGVDTYFWEPRYTNLTRFLRQPRRSDLQVVAGSFHADRRGLLDDLERARRRLRRDHIDLFLLFWVRSPARLSAEALATLQEFVDQGWIRSYGFSTHDRAIACEAIATGDWPVIMTRHSAAHRGAEQELLPSAAAAGVGVLGFSALCYGRMLRSSSVFERGPEPVDCYRYSLAQPAVAACVSAPRRHRELEHNLAVLDHASLADHQKDALIAHGTEVYADNKRFDRLLRRGGTAPLREAILELFERASEPPPASTELAVDGAT
ncbi:MAG TPA: aldo/keto reductase [Enhygromyxa sp.]|nr:aldo/keto reductase [Enhygromyxa sp.]